MNKKKIKYGILIVPQGTPLCTMEKGGDKDNKARYRFSNTGKKTSARLISLVTNETVMPDLYGAPWAHTKEGWVKAEDKITWFNSYKEASKTLASLTNRKRKILIGIVIAVIIAATAYLVYKHYQGKKLIAAAAPDTVPAAEPIAEPVTETIIPDEIPMD